MKILVTGGAGYIGSILVPALLSERHHVTVLDNLMYGGNSLIPYFIKKNFTFIKGDIRDYNFTQDLMNRNEITIHLAAIVGYPACKKNEALAIAVNEMASIEMARFSIAAHIPIIFGSTGSNYGSIPNSDKISTSATCTEETPLNPISLYGVTKTNAEKAFLDTGNSVCFRFATAFGASPRMRLDLLINDFVYKAVRNKHLIVYEKGFKRTFIHITDIVRAFLFTIDRFKYMVGKPYNVGDNSMNYTKEEIALKIKEKVDYYLHFAEIGTDEDKRDYEVSYERIRELGFKAETTIDEGIDELIKISQILEIKNPYSNI